MPISRRSAGTGSRAGPPFNLPMAPNARLQPGDQECRVEGSHCPEGMPKGDGERLGETGTWRARRAKESPSQPVDSEIGSQETAPLRAASCWRNYPQGLSKTQAGELSFSHKTPRRSRHASRDTSGWAPTHPPNRPSERFRIFFVPLIFRGLRWQLSY